MARTLFYSLMCTTVAVSLPNAIAEERQPLSITTVAPENPPPLSQVNDGTYRFSIQLKNKGTDTIILWPYVSIKIMDSDGEEVRRSTNIGRWGLIPAIFTSNESVAFVWFS
jgi:hypothetical protein